MCLGFFAVILDTTIVNVALPAVGASFHAGVTNLQWVVNGYNIVFAALLLTCGALADRRGAKRVFRTGVGVFLAGSLVCGLAPDLSVLLGGRVVQGLGAALLMPASLALITQAHPEPAERTRAVASWAVCAGAATATGPVLGGLLVGMTGWRSIFLVNLPVGAIVLILLARYPAESYTTWRGVDMQGQVLGVIALAAMAFGVTEAGSHGWEGRATLLPLAAALLAIAAFVATERKVLTPLLPPSLLAHRGFMATTGVGLLLNFGVYGQVFVLSLYFQQTRHFGALTTGLMLLPFAGVTLLGPPVTGRLIGRLGARSLMTGGQLLAAAGTTVLACAGPHTPYPELVPGLFLLGLGMAATMPSMTVAAMRAAPRELAGIASGVLTAARQVGAVLGVALLGSLIADTRHAGRRMEEALTIAVGAFLLGAVLSAYGARPVPAGPGVR
ncbi:MFS transporter [Streptomyces polygonati]|uniref:MFS transporter n=1 Tax=Streptomyces polygonati TaxID=1617087 RepID=A0ABV8HKS0_9ACTN